MHPEAELREILERYNRDWEANDPEGREALDVLTVALAHAASFYPTDLGRSISLFNGYVDGRDDPDVRAFASKVGEPYEALMIRTQTSLSPEDLAYIGLVELENRTFRPEFTSRYETPANVNNP